MFCGLALFPTSSATPNLNPHNLHPPSLLSRAGFGVEARGLLINHKSKQQPLEYNMKKTVTTTTCDICGRAIGPHEGLNQFVRERIALVMIEKQSGDVVLNDICQRCSDAILGEIQALADS